MGNLFEKLKRRRVFRVAAVYAVVAWLIIQIGDVILPTFNAPQWVNQTLVAVLFLGFPVALVLTWAIDLTPKGLANADQNLAQQSQHLNTTVLGLLALAVVFLILDRYWLTDTSIDQNDSTLDSSLVLKSSINLDYFARRGPRSFLAEVAITPDGSKIIYHSLVSGRRQLLLRDLSSFSSRVLLENPNDRPLGFNSESISPDGNSVLVSMGGEIQIVSLENSSQQTAAQIRNPTSLNAFNFRGWDWISNQEIVYAAVDGNLYLRSLESGNVVKLDVPKTESESLIWPYVLDDNRYILYTAALGGSVSDGNVSILDRVTGASVKLIENGANAKYLPSGHIVFIRDSELRAIRFDFSEMQVVGSDIAIADEIESVGVTFGRANYSVSDTGRLIYAQGGDLAQVNSRKYELRTIDGSSMPIGVSSSGWNRVRLSPDGNRVLLHSQAIDRAGDVYVYYNDSGILDRRTFTGVLTPIWSRDGESFLYVDTASGRFDLFRMSASGLSQPELLYSSPTRIEPFSVSPDGTQLLHTTGLPGSEDLRSVALNHENSQPVDLVVDPASNDTDISISPNGRWIAYRASGGIFVRPFPNAEEGRIQVGYGPSREPRWGPNSDELFYFSVETNEIIRTSLDTNSRLQIRQSEVLYSDVAPSSGAGIAYDVSADGNTFLVPMLADETDDYLTPQFATFSMVDNWFEELNTLLPINP